MANLPQQNTIIQYVADGITTIYVVPFYTPLNDTPVPGTPAINVYVTLQGATPNPLTDIVFFGVNYTFSTNLDPITGGTVNFIAGHVPPLGATVTLVRNVPAALNTEFANAQNFNGANLDSALSQLLLIEQQNKSYALERNISYVVNEYFSQADIVPNTQLPRLANNQFWMGQGGGVIAATVVQNPNTSVLASQLANNQPVTNGAGIVGYYDPLNNVAQTVKLFLDNMPTYVQNLFTNNRVNSNPTYLDTGAVNALVITVPNYVNYTLGDRFYIKVGHTNTVNGATLNINGIGATQINVSSSVACFIGDLVINGIALVEYDGTHWYLLNPNSMLQRAVVCASISLNMDQSFPNGSVFTLINFNQVIFDDYSMWNNTSKRFIAPYAGYYRVNVNVDITAGDAAATWLGVIFVNGVYVSALVEGGYSSTGTPNTGGNGTKIFKMAVGDYVDFRMLQSGSSSTTLVGDIKQTYFELELLGRL